MVDWIEIRQNEIRLSNRDSERRHFGARGMSSVRYRTRLGDLKNKHQQRERESTERRGNMGELSEFWEFLKSLNFGRLETVEFRPETLEFRSDISNLGTFLEHFWQSWNFGPFGVSSSSQQRIWYKFESYPYEKTTPDAGDGWARISFPKFQVRRQLIFETLFTFSSLM